MKVEMAPSRESCSTVTIPSHSATISPHVNDLVVETIEKAIFAPGSLQSCGAAVHYMNEK